MGKEPLRQMEVWRWCDAAKSPGRATIGSVEPARIDMSGPELVYGQAWPKIIGAKPRSREGSRNGSGCCSRTLRQTPFGPHNSRCRLKSLSNLLKTRKILDNH